MPQGSTRNGNGLFGDINITPLTDIFLVLLIIMMVVAPALSQSQRQITPPTTVTGEDLERLGVLVEIDAAGQFSVEGRPVGEAELPAWLAARLPAAEGKRLVIRGDRGTQNRRILEVMRAAHDAGYEGAIIAALPERGAAVPATPSEGAPTP